MRIKQGIVDIIIDELALAYADSYCFDEEKFEKLFQRSIDYICKYLINELNVLAFDYDRGYWNHFDTFEIEHLIYEVGRLWKSETVEPATYPQEKGFKEVDRFMRDKRLDDDVLFCGGGWDHVVKIYEANMGKTNACGFFL